MLETTRGGSCSKDEERELRRGPWTVEEDSLLIHYIARHGMGRWNLLAKCSGLNRSGKSCRLRWLNYLKPDIKRGNLTPAEQLLILQLHSKWGNSWSRIAQHLPGRTDNEIKNYWRTRMQKQARRLKLDARSATFRETVRRPWTPKMLEKMAIFAAAPLLPQSNYSTSITPSTQSASCSFSSAGCSTTAQLPDQLPMNTTTRELDTSSTGALIDARSLDSKQGGMEKINGNTSTVLAGTELVPIPAGKHGYESPSGYSDDVADNNNFWDISSWVSSFYWRMDDLSDVQWGWWTG